MLAKKPIKTVVMAYHLSLPNHTVKPQLHCSPPSKKVNNKGNGNFEYKDERGIIDKGICPTCVQAKPRQHKHTSFEVNEIRKHHKHKANQSFILVSKKSKQKLSHRASSKNLYLPLIIAIIRYFFLFFQMK